jgi:hypothetical protein
MNYLVCSRCRYETRELAERCKQCGEPYVSEWDPSWYSQPWTLASMGHSPVAKQFANWFLGVAAAFTLYGFAVHAIQKDRDAWGNYLIFTGFLAFCCYEVWAFSRGRRTSIDHVTHEAIPKNTGWRVFGLTLDIAFATLCVYSIVAHDA